MLYAVYSVWNLARLLNPQFLGKQTNKDNSQLLATQVFGYVNKGWKAVISAHGVSENTHVPLCMDRFRH